MRNGFYCIYNGREYSVGKMDDDSLHLRSRNIEDLDNGFSPYERDRTLYIKKVKKEEISRYYRVHLKVVYKGHIYKVAGRTESQIIISSGDTKVAHELDMDRTDKYEYKKWVDIADVEPIEEEEDWKI